MQIDSELALLLKYIFLGFIQGFTEPIPISSSGHLVIIREIFDLNMNGLSFEILVNAGSLIAISFVYRADLFRLSRNVYRFLLTRDNNAKEDYQFFLYLIIATSITAIIALFLADYIESVLSSALVAGFTLLITGVALWIIRNLRGIKSDHDLTIKDAIIIGLAQAVALIPGISRSGATIVAAMLLGMKKETALRFSFLLFIPISLGITILSTVDMINDPDFNTLAIPYLLAFIASVIATLYSLNWFINVMIKGNLKYFSFYCFIIGFLIIIFI